jgi:hypothetical protein
MIFMMIESRLFGDQVSVQMTIGRNGPLDQSNQSLTEDSE